MGIVEYLFRYPLNKPTPTLEDEGNFIIALVNFIEIILGFDKVIPEI